MRPRAEARGNESDVERMLDGEGTSMRPRAEARGNAALWSAGCAAARHFNEASRRSARKRAQKVPPRQVANFTSMRPRAEARGNLAEEVLVVGQRALLQ